MIYFSMKLTNNEKFVLKLWLEDAEIGNTEIAAKLNITPQAVGKIKRQLFSKGFIKNTELKIDYEKFGIGLHAIVLMEVHLSALKKDKLQKLRNEVLKPTNAIRSYGIPQTDITHIIIYAFRDIKEYDNYFKKVQKDFGELVEIKDSFVFSSGSIIKSSSKDLFLKALEEMGKGKKENIL